MQKTKTTPASDQTEVTILLRPDISVVPYPGNRIVLYVEDGQSTFVDCDDLDVKSVGAAMLRGTTLDELGKLSSCGVPTAESQSAAHELVEQLTDAGLLQRRGITHSLSPAEKTRFASVISYFSRFESPQDSRFDKFERLRASHVLLIGLGGLGASTLCHLLSTGVGRITAVDSDKVEESNLARQTFYAETDIGSSKVEAAARNAERLSSFTNFSALDRRISGHNDITDIVRDYGKFDLIIQAADSPIWDLTKWIAKAAMETGIPSLHCSYLGVGPLYIPGHTACPACMLPPVESQIENPEEIVSFQQQLQDKGVPRSILSTSLGQFALFLAQEAIAYLAQVSETSKTMNGLIRIAINGASNNSPVSLQWDPRCGVCGTRPVPVSSK